MSWWISLGLVFGIIGAGLFRVPSLPWSGIQRIIYKLSPRVRHYQDIERLFLFVRVPSLTEPYVIFSQTHETDFPHEISEKTARILYGVLKSTDFYSPCDKEAGLQSVYIDNGMFSFSFNNNKPDYHIPYNEGIKRFQIANDGFLNEYYTGKGAVFLVTGFLLQLIGTLPLL